MATKKITKVPLGMKKLSPTKKEEKMNKPYTYDPRPDFCIEEKDLPAMKDWKVGENYTLEIQVTMEDYSSGMSSDGEVKTRGRFRIVAVGVEEKE